MRDIRACSLRHLAQDIGDNTDPDNPFAADNDGFVLRYDGLRILRDATTQWPPGGLIVIFLWRGHETYRMPVDSIDFAQGGVLELSGITGHVRGKLC